MPLKYTTAGGVATLVRHRGSTTLPEDPPPSDRGEIVIGVHDAGSSGVIFDDLLDALAASHSPIAYDQPGHGRSGGLDAPATVQAMADHLRAMVASWGIERAVLVGDGLGAAVALEAASSGSWVAGVVLLGSLADRDTLDAEIEQLSAITSGRARRDFDRSGYAAGSSREAYQKAFAAWVQTDPRAALGARLAQRAWTTALPDVPVLVVIGEETEPAAADAARELADRLPASRVVTLPGAGRRALVEQPVALAATIESFISGLPAGAADASGATGADSAAAEAGR